MTKKNILRPGKHQFAPKSHAVHNNDNISDESAEWYLQHYPHIAALFEQCPANENTVTQEEKMPEVAEVPSEQSPEGANLPNQ